MERQGRIHKKTLIDGTADDSILIWDDTAGAWVEGDITDLTAILPDGTAAGQMLFWTGAAWTYAETSELIWNDTNKTIGINDSTPDAGTKLDVKGTVMLTRLLAGGISP